MMHEDDWDFAPERAGMHDQPAPSAEVDVRSRQPVVELADLAFFDEVWVRELLSATGVLE